MPAIDIATSLESISNAALQVMLPNEVSNGRIEVAYGPEVMNELGVTHLVVKGSLPSGLEWECPLELDMHAVHYANDGAWLASNELARELKKAAHAFKVMVALDASNVKPTPKNQWDEWMRVRHNTAVFKPNGNWTVRNLLEES